MIPLACGPNWDQADAQAAALRARAIADLMQHAGKPAEADIQVPIDSEQNQSVQNGIRTTLHSGSGSQARVYATIEPTVDPEHGLVHFRLTDHPQIKDMRMTVRHDHSFAPEPDLAAQADLIATMLESYAADMVRSGRGCRTAPIRAAQAIGDALVIQCRDAWRDGDRVPLMLINASCPTPWTRASAWLKDQSGRSSGNLMFLSREARHVLREALPQMLTVDWKDEVQKGTGIRTTVLHLAPYATVDLVSSHTSEDPMAALRARALLPLPADGILGIR